LVDGDQIGIKWVANELAIQQAVEKTNATRVITFHSRVNLAKVLPLVPLGAFVAT
jgi:hypothetical protein